MPMSLTMEKMKRRGQRENEKSKKKNGEAKGERQRAENQLRRGEEVGREEGRTMPIELWKEGEVRKPMTWWRRRRQCSSRVLTLMV